MLERIVKTLPPTLRLLATTATANNRVMDDGDDTTVSPPALPPLPTTVNDELVREGVEFLRRTVRYASGEMLVGETWYAEASTETFDSPTTL